MKNFGIADKWKIVISKDLFFTLAQEAYWHTKFAIEHAADRLEAMNQFRSYIWIKNCVKVECEQNRINYKNYITDQEKVFADLIDEKFPLVNELPGCEDSDIITDLATYSFLPKKLSICSAFDVPKGILCLID